MIDEKRFRSLILFYAVLFVVLCVFMIFYLLRLRRQVEELKLSSASTVSMQIPRLNQIIHQKKENISQLEEQALWYSQQEDIMSFLTEQAKKAKVSIVGVEQMKEYQVDTYQAYPVKLTLKGDYHAFGRFLNRLELSQKKVKLSYFSIKRRKEHLIMEVIVSSFNRLEEKSIQ